MGLMYGQSRGVAVVPGSVGHVAATARLGSVALAALSADVVLLADVSGSMGAVDIEADGRTRYQRLCDELEKLQARMPGHILVLAFSDIAVLAPGGVPPFLGGGTGLHRALGTARQYNVEGVRFIVISDGQPDDAQKALATARKLKAPISTIYIGPAGGQGAIFLQQLADQQGGQALLAFHACQLAGQVVSLLEAKTNGQA